jgi:DNA-binding CsgD family transcriptional regulator
MRALRARALRPLLHHLHEVYALRSLDAFALHVISRLPSLVPAEVVSYNEMNVPRRRCVLVANPPELLTPEAARVFERHVADHPLVTHYRRTGDGRARMISDFLTRRQFRHTGLYREVFQPRRLECQIAVTLPAPPALVVGFGLSRQRRDFSEQDRVVLDVLRPHLVQAYRNAEAVSELRRERALAEDAVRAAGAEIVSIDAGGRIRSASALARARLAAYFGGGRRDADRVPAGLDEWIRTETARAGASDHVPPPRRPLVVRGTRGRLVVRLLEHGDRPLLLLQEYPEGPDAAALEALGLTRREAEVLAWVTRGKHNAEIAALLGIRPRTVHKHLDHVFDKLGVDNRTAAAARALAEAVAAPGARG